MEALFNIIMVSGNEEYEEKEATIEEMNKLNKELIEASDGMMVWIFQSNKKEEKQAG